MCPDRRVPGGVVAAARVKRSAAKASTRLSSSVKRPIGRVPPSGFGTWVVTEVVAAGATTPRHSATSAMSSTRRASRCGMARRLRSLKKLTGSGAFKAGACCGHRRSPRVSGAVKVAKREWKSSRLRVSFAGKTWACLLSHRVRLFHPVSVRSPQSFQLTTHRGGAGPGAGWASMVVVR